MRKPILFLLCTALSVGAASGAKAPQPQTVQYEVKLKSGAFGDMGTRKMWIRGDYFRWEYMSAGLPLKLVKNSQGVFLIHPWNKVAAKYPAKSSRSKPLGLFPGPAEPVSSFLKTVKAAKQKPEKVGTQLCDVYSYKDPIGGKQCRIWVGKSTGKPVKLTTEGAKGKADPITATYTKFVVGASVPDSMFKIPSGYEIRPMPGGGKPISGKLAPENQDKKGPA